MFEEPFIYILGIFSLILIGNSLFSWITFRKQIKLTILEKWAFSLCIGIVAIIFYGYLVDLVTKSVGINISNPFVLYVVAPMIFSLGLKILNLKLVIGKGVSLFSHIKLSLKNTWHTLHAFISSFQAPNDRKKYRVLVIFIGAIFLTFFFKFFWTFIMSFGQFSIDPYNWVLYSTSFAENISIDYSMMHVYPAGFVMFSAFFLEFIPGGTFSIQFAFLKWLPFFNIFLLTILLFLICKRLTGRRLYFVVIFLFTLATYFFYRFDMLIPCSLSVIMLGFLALTFLIPNLPVSISYLIAGTTLLIHPINGILICGFFFVYKLVNGIIWLFHKMKNKRNAPEESIPNTPNNSLKLIVYNAMAFLIPVIILFVSLTIRFDPNWITSYLWYLQTSTTRITSIFNINVLDIEHAFVQVLSGNPIVDWPLLGTETSWLFGWGNSYVILTCICLIFPRSKNVKSIEKKRLLRFVRLANFIGLVIFLFPSVGFLLNFIEILPGGKAITDIIKSYFYYWASLRLFEVTTILNAILLTVCIEHFIHKFVNQKSNLVDSSKPKHSEKYYLLLIITVTFSANAIFYQPYYEYFQDDFSVKGMLWFRDYLDQQNFDPGGITIEYSREDTQLDVLVGVLLPKGNNYTKSCCDITLTYLSDNFTNNPSNTVDFLIISFIDIDDTIADGIRGNYLQSSYDLFHNNSTLILKF